MSQADLHADMAMLVLLLQGVEQIEVCGDDTMSDLLDRLKLSDSTHEVVGDPRYPVDRSNDMISKSAAMLVSQSPKENVRTGMNRYGCRSMCKCCLISFKVATLHRTIIEIALRSSVDFMKEYPKVWCDANGKHETILRPAWTARQAPLNLSFCNIAREAISKS